MSPVSSSSPTSTPNEKKKDLRKQSKERLDLLHRIENGGSSCEKPKSGGFEQLVTNFRNNLRSSSVKSLERMSHSQTTTR